MDHTPNTNRAAVCFFSSDELDWQPLPFLGMQAGATGKMLSISQESGACTWLVRLEAGWKLSEPGYHEAPVELFILRGTLHLPQIQLKRHGYAYLPAHTFCSLWCSPGDCELLVMYNGCSNYHMGSTLAHDYGGEGMIWRDTDQQQWEKPTVAGMGEGFKIKMLRYDALSGERSWLAYAPGKAGTPRYRFRSAIEKHSCSEEAFFLGGDGVVFPYSLQEGRASTRGHYLYWPPHTHHGPMASHLGSFVFFRSWNGPFDVRWQEADSNEIEKAYTYAISGQLPEKGSE